MPALVKNSFTEALVVVLKCTDAINPFEEIWGALLCSARPVLTCQHDVERFKHDSNFAMTGIEAILLEGVS